MKLKPIVPIAVVAVLAAAGWYLLRAPRAAPGTLAAAGTVEATEARLGFELPGRIAVLSVREGQRVDAGEELARLDDREHQVRRAQAEARVAAVRAQLAELEAGTRREEIDRGRATLAEAAERVADAERDRERARVLFEGGAISREAFEKAGMAVELAEQRHRGARAGLELLERGPRPERLAAARAELTPAESARDAVDVTLARLRLVAPRAGVIAARHREPGEAVAAGSPVVTLLDLDDRWVRIYVPEYRLGRVALGQRAAIASDSFADRTYVGEVAFIGSEAEFTPRNVQTSEERVRLVYPVRVRILEDPRYELKPGLPVDVVLQDAP